MAPESAPKESGASVSTGQMESGMSRSSVIVVVLLMLAGSGIDSTLSLFLGLISPITL